ncbi:acyl-CoA dehydrogenase family protein [Streptomyces sp. NBC_01176]|uniref:acyl-CoA dehydrogenase family protein n=1 Tax=Streptomyces sp. NBC_01176 TaxID=2903760 RepID=UPI0038692872
MRHRRGRPGAGAHSSPMTTRSARAGRESPLRPRSEYGDAPPRSGPRTRVSVSKRCRCRCRDAVRGGTEASHVRCQVARDRLLGREDEGVRNGCGRPGRRAGPPNRPSPARWSAGGRGSGPRRCASTPPSRQGQAIAIDAGYSAVDRARQPHGGYGRLSDHGTEKIVRDPRVHQSPEGTNEIMRVIVTRGLTEAFG